MAIQELRKIELKDDHINDVAEVHLSTSGNKLLEISIFGKERCVVLRLNGSDFEAYENVDKLVPAELDSLRDC